HLTDGPVVLYRLEDGEIAQILIRKLFTHGDEILRKQFRISTLKHAVDVDADRPVQFLSDGLLIEGGITQLKEQPDFLALFSGIVKRFHKHGERFSTLVRKECQKLRKFLDLGVIQLFRRYYFVDRIAAMSGHDLYDQNGMMCSNRPAALGHQCRMRDLFGVTDFLDRANHRI